MQQEVKITLRLSLEDRLKMEDKVHTSFTKVKLTLGFSRNFQHSPRILNPSCKTMVMGAGDEDDTADKRLEDERLDKVPTLCGLWR